jgi:nucleoside-diphosphate-sugar epimerase
LKPILKPGEDLTELKVKTPAADGEEQEEKPEEDEDIDRDKGEDNEEAVV